MDGKVIVADAGSGETVMVFKNDLMVIGLALAPNGPWVALRSQQVTTACV